MSLPVAGPAEHLEHIASRADAAGIRRVHALAWRDLDDPSAGGSELHANEILCRWASAGLDVVLHAGAVEGQPARATRNGIDVRRGGGKLAAWVAGPRSVRRSLDRDHDALLEIWHGVSFFAPWWSGVPTVGVFHHVHTDQFHQVLPFGLAHVAEVLERRVYPRLYRGRPLIALSNSVRDEMVRELHWDPSNVHVVEPGVADRYTPGRPEERSPHPLVVAVGRLMPQKHFDVAVRTLLAVKARRPDLEAVIAGDGPERERLHEQVHVAGAEGWLRVAGFVADDELVALYRRAWVLLSASQREGWGMTVTEAGACATPAVVTDITGHREAVVDGETGVLCPDERGLADALAALLEERSADRRARMGEAAARHAAGFRWDATARRVFDVLADEAIRFRSA